MRFFLLTASAIAMTSGAALAEGAQAPQPLPPVTIVADTYDWSGAYVGLGYSSNMGDIDFFNPNVAQALDDGNGASIFAGYMMQSGNLVYGGELAYSMLNEQTVTGFAPAIAHVEYVFDASARVGYAMDRFLVFGQLGYSAGNYFQASGDWGLSGFSYGVGADYAVSDNFSVGLLYTGRQLEGDNPDGLGQTVEIELNSIALRAAFRF